MSVQPSDRNPSPPVGGGGGQRARTGVLETLLRHGLRCEGSVLEYQPVVRLTDGRIVGAEATVRGKAADRHEGRHRMSPRVLDLLGREGARPFAHDEGFSLSVNLSAGDLDDAGLVPALGKLRAMLGARPGGLVAEITEHQLVRSTPALSRILALRDAGIGIVIDEFGTGFSSLHGLQHLAVDALKIDRTFVGRLDGATATTAVIRHVIRLGVQLGYRIVAEGVEHPFQAELLREHGVEYAQGPLFGRPMPMRKLLDLLGGGTALG